MAQHDTMNHDIGKPFKERVSNSPFANVVVVENVSAGYHTLAEAFSAGATRRRIAPICSIAACRGSASPPLFPRTPNTRCSGRSFSRAMRGRASAAGKGPMAKSALRIISPLVPAKSGDPGWILACAGIADGSPSAIRTLPRARRNFCNA